MGDVRYERYYREVADAEDRSRAIQALPNDAVIMALAAASQADDPLLSNVLATEAMNRMHRAGLIAEHLAEGVLAVDADNRITFVNPAAVEILGYERDELVGAVLHETLHVHEDGSPLPREACAVVTTLDTGRTVHRRDHGDGFRRKDGRVFPVEMTSAPVARDALVQGAVVFFADLTKEREAEVARERLAAIVDSSEDAVTTETPDCVVTSWNPGAERMFGWRADEIVGRSIEVLVPEELRDEQLAVTRRVGRTGEPWRGETVRLRRDGARLPVSLVLSPLRGRSGRVVGVSAIYRDMSRIREAEGEIARLLERERALHAETRYRLATLLPALAWGLGSVIVFRTLLLLGVVASPWPLGRGLLAGSTTLALVGGLAVGAAVYAWTRRRERARQPAA